MNGEFEHEWEKQELTSGPELFATVAERVMRDVHLSDQDHRTLPTETDKQERDQRILAATSDSLTRQKQRTAQK